MRAYYYELALIEEMVQSPPRGMAEWRLFRIEYGDTGIEGRIWLPPGSSVDYVENWLESYVEDTLEGHDRRKSRGDKHEVDGGMEE